MNNTFDARADQAYQSQAHQSQVGESLNRRALAVAIVCLFPALVWILLNQAPPSGDESQYARASLELYRTLLRSPAEWTHRMLDIFPSKPNGLLWIGQFFVPVGYLSGSVDKGFQLSVWITQLLTVVAMWRSICELSGKDVAIATLGALIVASAPLFFTLGTYYMVESLQTLAVACFVLILARAATSDPAMTFSHLVAASAFAALTKATAPLFCLWPGVGAIWTASRQPRRPGTWRWRRARATLLGGLFLLIVAAAWYHHNWAWVLSHAKAASAGPVAAIWGREDTFLNTLSFWLLEAARTLFLVPVLAPALALLVIVAACGRSRSVRFDRVVFVVALQIATVLGVFSFSANREPRYLLPLLPYVAVVLCWSIHRIGRPMVTWLGVATFTAQLAGTYMVAFGLASGPSGPPIRPLMRDGHEARLLSSIVGRTCRARRPTQYASVIAIDSSFRGDWLAPEPANFVATRDHAGRDGTAPCRYQYIGGSFFGANADKAWELLHADRVEYVVTLDPDVYPPKDRVYNESLNATNFQRLWAHLTTSELYAREGPVSEDPGIVVFRRTTVGEQQQRSQIFARGDHPDYVAIGRALSDQGKHRDAVAELNKATTLNPTDVEAWANLALAHERWGNAEHAVMAGNRARQLSPTHYYVNLGLARALYQQKQWTSARARADDAALFAPGALERVSALAIAGLSSFQIGDSERGCDYLRIAEDVQPTRQVAEERTRQRCDH